MPDNELILAQEQSVLNKLGVGKETQGTLILTNQRLLFIAASEEVKLSGEMGELRYADVDDISKIPRDPSNFSIPLSAITSIKGSSGIISNPKLNVKWQDGVAQKSAEFQQTITGIRKKNLNDWAKVVQDIKSGKKKVEYAPIPSKDTLEGKILYVMSDMQDKGLLEIEEETEQEFKIDLGPDNIEASCEKLASQGLLDRIDDPSGDKFYRRRSPLGEDDLSS